MTKVSRFFENPYFIYFECAKKKFNGGLVLLLAKLILHLFAGGHMDEDSRIFRIVADECNVMIHRGESASVGMEGDFQFSCFSGFENRVGRFTTEYIGFAVLDLSDQQFVFTVVANRNRYGFVLSRGSEMDSGLGNADDGSIVLFFLAEAAEVLADVCRNGNPVVFHLSLFAFDGYIEEVFSQSPILYARSIIGNQYLALFLGLDDLRVAFHIEVFGYMAENKLYRFVAFVVGGQAAGAVGPVGVEIEKRETPVFQPEAGAETFCVGFFRSFAGNHIAGD